MGTPKGTQAELQHAGRGRPGGRCGPDGVSVGLPLVRLWRSSVVPSPSAPWGKRNSSRFAMLFNGNPYERLRSPEARSGFETQGK